ncbi:MAG TPA: hypothetical protein VFE58_19010 [Tepidisphaeraceae bacterium]|jgi:hypothetical protein|nr:hypothetical protein [Tepidisphaeraceae bacterium]
MTTLILSIVVPFAVLLGVFLLVRVWLAKQPDRLVARHRGLGVLIWVAALLMLTALILRYYAAPGAALTKLFGLYLALMLLVFAIWARRHLSRQLRERLDPNAA